MLVPASGGYYVLRGPHPRSEAGLEHLEVDGESSCGNLYHLHQRLPEQHAWLFRKIFVCFSNSLNLVRVMALSVQERAVVEADILKLCNLMKRWKQHEAQDFILLGTWHEKSVPFTCALLETKRL